MTFAAAMPALQSSLADGRLSLLASGHWTARHASELDALVQGITRQPAGIVNAVLIDFRNLQAFDTFGALAAHPRELASTPLGDGIARFPGFLQSNSALRRRAAHCSSRIL